MSQHNFQRIKKAIEFILTHAQQQPKLDDLAQHLSLSPHHLHRLFVQQVGITPQQFLHVINIHHAKTLLNQNKDIFSSALNIGLSGAGRLHDQFVTIEAVSPGEFKSGGDGIQMYWCKAMSPFGHCFVAWTDRGIHKIEFIEETPNQILTTLKELWPKALFVERPEKTLEIIEHIFNSKQPTKLWVKGTNFQINVWKALLNIPEGSVSTYSDIAKTIGNSKAQRAVGSAIGKNPIAVLIPCHRVIRSSGVLNHYRWESWRKALILGKEFTQSGVETENDANR